NYQPTCSCSFVLAHMCPMRLPSSQPHVPQDVATVHLCTQATGDPRTSHPNTLNCWCFGCTRTAMLVTWRGPRRPPAAWADTTSKARIAGSRDVCGRVCSKIQPQALRALLGRMDKRAEVVGRRL